MNIKIMLSVVLALIITSNIMQSVYADSSSEVKPIISDNGLNISQEELEQAIKYWPVNDVLGALKDDAIKYNLLSRFVQNRKISDKLEEITKESDQEFYWQQKFAVRNLQAKLYLKNFKDKLVVPDMSALAKEELLVNKDKYTKKPEERLASHILFKCESKTCNRDEKKIEVQKIIDKLNEGDNFEELVAKYSDDPGSKARKGKLNNWVKLGGRKMDPYFVGGLFDIKEKNGYSEIVETKFGLHIIRLDKIKPVSYVSEDLIIPGLVEKLEKDYKSLAEGKFTNDLVLSENSVVDDPLFVKLLEEAKAEKTKNVPKVRRPVTIKKFIRQKTDN